MTSITVSLIYAFVVLTSFFTMVTFNHKIKAPYRWYLVTLAFFWPVVVAIIAYHFLMLLFGVITITYNALSARFHANWKALK